MAELKNKLAVVTGASSGIGACLVRDLLAAGLIVVGLARRVERIEELRTQLPEEQQAHLHAIKCDVGDDAQVASAFAEIAEKHGAVDVLINNAGCLRSGQLCKMSSAEVQQILQTNVMGVVNCTRYAFAAMQANNNEGQVILINSILGHSVPFIQGMVPKVNIYPGTKHALRAINEIYRQEFKELGTNIRISSISPGLVDTELIAGQVRAFAGDKILLPEDVSRVVLFVLNTPPHVQIYEVIVKPQGDVI